MIAFTRLASPFSAECLFREDTCGPASCFPRVPEVAEDTVDVISPTLASGPPPQRAFRSLTAENSLLFKAAIRRLSQEISLWLVFRPATLIRSIGVGFLNACNHDSIALRWLEFQPPQRFFTGFTQPGSNVCSMKSFQFQEVNLLPVDIGANSAYDAASHLWAIRCWPQDRAPKLDSG